VLTYGGDSARVWDAETGKPVGDPMPSRVVLLSRGGRRVPTVGSFASFSPDGRRVLTVGDGSARVWDAETGKPVGGPMPSGGRASFSPDGRQVLTYGGDSARLWDAETGKPLGPAMQPGGTVRRAWFRPDGRAILVLGSERARFWFSPHPVELSLPQIKLWVDVLTTITMDEQGVTRSLTPDEWNRKRKELDDAGGPPVIRLPRLNGSGRRE
jgi:hypothetical protein